MKFTLIVIAFVTLVSCSSTKTTTENVVQKETAAMDTQKMIENGYIKGTIVASSEENDCPFVIEVSGRQDNYYLDPINLDETFKKDGVKVWFTYNGLKMMNRCEKASPISINDIQKRAE